MTIPRIGLVAGEEQYDATARGSIAKVSCGGDVASVEGKQFHKMRALHFSRPII